MKACAACRALLKDELAFSNKIAALPAAEPANDVWALVRSRTKRRAFAWSGAVEFLFPRTLLRKTVALTAVLGVFAVTLYTGLGPREERRAVVPTNQSAVAIGWSDDPLGEHSDAVVKFIDDL